MNNKLEIVWSLTFAAFAAGILWGLAIKFLSAGILADLVFIVLGGALFVGRVVLEQYFKDNIRVGLSGGLYFIGLMLLGSMFFAYQTFGLVMAALVFLFAYIGWKFSK